VSLGILIGNFGTSIVSPGVRNIADEFDVNVEVGISAISLYLMGFAAGPLFAAPLSEEYGRNALYIAFMAVFIVLQIGVARVQNVSAFLVLRFLSGVAVSPPATLGIGTITDVFPLLPLTPGMELWDRARCCRFYILSQSFPRAGFWSHCRWLRH
jgi:MFS family permease